MKRGFASLSLFTVVGCNKDIFGSTCRQRAYAYISWRSGGLFSLALSPMSHTVTRSAFCQCVATALPVNNGHSNVSLVYGILSVEMSSCVVY